MSASPAAVDHLYLIGRTPFKQYLDFMTTEPVDARAADRKQIADDWRAAHDYLRLLEAFEATWADNPPLLPVPQMSIVGIFSLGRLCSTSLIGLKLG